MKIGFYLNDSGFENRNLTDPASGNPGIGGSEYCFVMLMYHLSLDQQYEMVCYHLKHNQLPPRVSERIVESEVQAIENASKDKVDVFIIRSPAERSVFAAIDHFKVNTISWAHNYLIGESVRLHQQSEYIKRVVFVGRQQYDRYIDCTLIHKSAYIFNMVSEPARRRNANPRNHVTYTGNLIFDKGFHILARCWKDILKRVPDAELHVIGSVKIYDEKSEIGKYGIAEPDYEKLFMPYLTDQAGNVLPSVQFHGALGAEKSKIYEETKVGVVNPSARTETFGLSAVEMSLLGIPVCTRGKNGLLDTVVHGQTGLLSNTPMGLTKNIVRLLKDDALNNSLGENAIAYAQRFAPERITEEWKQVINDVHNNIAPKYVRPQNYYWNNLKWLRMFNRFIWKLVGTDCWIGVVDLEGMVRKALLSLLRRRNVK